MAGAEFLRKQAPSEMFEPPKTEKIGSSAQCSLSALHTGSVSRLPRSRRRNRNPNLPGLSVAHIFSHWRFCAAQGF